MKKLININLFILALMLGLTSCKKTEYAFGDLTSPSALTLATTINGVSTTYPNGNGSGDVAITLAANNVINYKVDFGDGQTSILSSGTITHKYSIPGTADYTITVNAIGKGGTTSTISKKIKVFVAFEIPAEILAALTGGTSKTWVSDKAAAAHFGVGYANTFLPDKYAAGPNERAPEMYDDEITFTKDANNNISMVLDNKGLTFIIAAATNYYGFSGGDGNYAVNTSGTKNLIFMNATSASTSANSTRIQFMVPGNGLVNVGCGSNTYEILSATSTQINLRTIGVDGNAWYQKLKVK